MGGKSTYLRQAALIAILAQMGSLRAGRSAALPHHRPHFHAHRRIRQPGARPFHVHGGDDRDGRDPEHRHPAQPDRARRNRPRHRHLRRPGAGLGGGGAHPRAHPRQDAVRHPLPRADRTGRATRRRAQPARLGEGGRRPHHLPAQGGARARPTAATASKWRAWRACRSA